MTQLPEPLRQFLADPNPAVMSSLGKEGQPVSVATWYLLAGDRILINLDAGRKRLEHLRRDPRISLTVLSGQSWYVHVSLQGRVVEIFDDTDLADIDRLSVRYLGNPYGNRTSPRVSAYVEIDRWHGWESGHPMKVDD